MNNILSRVGKRKNASSHGGSQTALLDDSDLKIDNYLNSSKEHHTKTTRLRHIHSRKRFHNSIENVRFMKNESKKLRES